MRRPARRTSPAPGASENAGDHPHGHEAAYHHQPRQDPGDGLAALDDPHLLLPPQHIPVRPRRLDPPHQPRVVCVRGGVLDAVDRSMKRTAIPTTAMAMAMATRSAGLAGGTGSRPSPRLGPKNHAMAYATRNPSTEKVIGSGAHVRAADAQAAIMRWHAQASPWRHCASGGGKGGRYPGRVWVVPPPAQTGQALRKRDRGGPAYAGPRHERSQAWSWQTIGPGCPRASKA